MRQLYCAVAIIALFALAAHADLDADLCQVRATAFCGRKGCASGRGSWSPAAGCQVKCADCESRRDRHAVLYTRAEFSAANCTSGGLESISAGWAGKCQRDNSFVSCTKDTCYTHRFADANCRGRRELVDVVASGVCLPTGSGGAELWRATTAAAIHPFDGDAACPHKDVHKLECAIAIAECVADCFGGIEACLECIVKAVGTGDAKKCCETLSHYVGFNCKDCDHV